MKFVIIIAIGIIFSIGIFSGILPAFAEANYSLSGSQHKFSNQPIVCIYEPYVPDAREIIVDFWLKETELGVMDWQHELKASEYVIKDRWNIETQIISLEFQIYFDNKDCDVEIRFDATAPEAAYAGVHSFDGKRSQIKLVYTDLEVCRTWTEGIYRYSEWCYKEDWIRSKALGNTATHEFGHAIGLGHYTSDDPYENYLWNIDPYASPSVMTTAVHYDEDRNEIRKIDVNKVREIYDSKGFGEPKQTTKQKMPIFEDKNYGGFESFFTSSSEYFKEAGKIQFVTIGGKITEQAYSKRQNAFVTVVFPDGHEEIKTAFVLKNRQFAIQIRVDDTIQTGEYALEATYIQYDSQKIIFTVYDGVNLKIEPKEISIPAWIKNNAKWWAAGSIEDRDFVMGMQHLAQENIIQVDNTDGVQADPNQEIPEWIRNNAKWWADGLISDSDFVNGIQFLAQQGIIQVN